TSAATGRQGGSSRALVNVTCSRGGASPAAVTRRTASRAPGATGMRVVAVTRSRRARSVISAFVAGARPRSSAVTTSLRMHPPRPRPGAAAAAIPYPVLPGRSLGGGQGVSAPGDDAPDRLLEALHVVRADRDRKS